MKRLRDTDLRVGLVSSKYYRSKVLGKRRIRPSKRGRMRLAAGIAPELKNHDTAISFGTSSTMGVPSTGQLALIAQGDTGVTRDGRAIVVKSVNIRLSAVYTPSTGAIGTIPTSMVGVWLVLDKQPNGAAATATDVIDIAGASIVSSWRKNIDNDKRFEILKTFYFNFGDTGGWVSAAGDAILGRTDVQEYYKQMELPIQFSGTTGVITALSTNNLFLVQAAQGSNGQVSVAGVCRLRFVG